MIPLLSVVIPTHRRPHFLRRAIDSALASSLDKDVDVIVVPNGGDDSWKPLAHAYRNEPRVSWRYLDAGHACKARNLGLLHARGKYVRFLDDDDYLYPEATGQLTLLESHGADACTAPLDYVRVDGRKRVTYHLPDTGDYPTAALLSIGISLTQGSVYRRSVIDGARWRDDIALYDDYIWALSLAERVEMHWLRTPNPVGAYVQHHSDRLSRTRRSSSNSRSLVTAILHLHDHLTRTERHTPERRHAVASALLTHAHSVFPSNPIFLGRVIRQAYDIDPAAKPTQALFRNYPYLNRNLIAAEWGMIAPRYITRSYRRMSWIAKGLLSESIARS